jgi:uncharacterized YigZ family protein
MERTYYRTVRGPGEAEIVIKRSRFIGYAMPVDTEAAAAAFIEDIMSRHKQANHNCSAYIVGDRNQHQKASDDGEPSGTAGKPILEVIKNQQLSNVAVVVTRYFGGIMLGAGGLVRAYTDGAVAGLAAAVPVYRVLHTPLQVTIDYSWFGKIEHELRGIGVTFGDVEFTDKVSLICWPFAAEAELVAARLTDVTAAQAMIEALPQEYVEHEDLPGSLG